ncbi:MAG TPA: hypothetical protein VF316_01885 [Polyangiaceae bacterium]
MAAAARPSISVEGIVRIDKSRRKFAAQVYAPERKGKGEYACRVTLSLFTPLDTQVIGATAKQARELALGFVQELIGKAIFQEKPSKKK